MNPRFYIPLALVAALGGQLRAQAQDTSTTSTPAAGAPAAAPADASAQSSDELPFAPDRPGFSNGTGIVPQGHIQIEAGLGAARSGDEHDADFGEMLVRVPVAPRAEIRLGVPSYLVARQGGRTAGFDDSSLEAKFSLHQGPKAAYALMVNTTLPTGSRRVAEHRFQPGVTLAANYTLSDKFGITLNAGGVRASDGGQRFNQVFAASCFNFTLTSRLGTFAELYALNRTEAGGSTQKYADGGVTYLLTPRTQLDINGGLGLGNHVGGPDYFYGAGVARLF